MAVAQIILAWVSLGFAERVDMQHERSVLHHFFAPYSEGQGPAECGSDARSGLPLAFNPRSFTVLKGCQRPRALAISGTAKVCVCMQLHKVLLPGGGLHSLGDILCCRGRAAVAGRPAHDPQGDQPDAAAAPARIPRAVCVG